jgi:hypothetical protein
MGKGIYLIHADNRLTELREEPYDSEALLQRLLADHPNVLAGESGGTVERRWLLVRREAPVPDAADGGGRWSLDHLFLDQDAVPTLVEVKRSSDTRIRREVVGQMLDYAANAVVYWPPEVLRTTYQARCEAAGLDPDQELIASLELPPVTDGADVVEAFWQRAKTNLQAGRVRLVFVADVIPPELRRVVEFLNQQMDPAEVLAVEVRQYVGDGLRTLVPSLIGQTAEAQQRKGGGHAAAGRQWDEASFAERVREQADGELALGVARRLLAWAGTHTSRVYWGKGQRAGGFVPIVTHEGVDHQLFAVWSDGRVEFYFQWYAGKPPFSDEALRRELLGRLNAIPGVSLPADAITRRPSVRLAAFAPESAFAGLIAVYEWFIATVRAVA